MITLGMAVGGLMLILLAWGLFVVAAAETSATRVGAAAVLITTVVAVTAFLFLLVGCSSVTPYVAAKHVDATPLQGGNDAWDLACAGVKKRGQLSVKAGWCENLRGGGIVEFEVEYELFGERE